MTFEQIVMYILFPAGGYLLGSVPFAWVIGKINGVDIRTVGSKNIGATNLGRTLGKRFFWMAFLLDAAKGFVPVFVAAMVVGHTFQRSVSSVDFGPNVSITNINYTLIPRTPQVPLWAPLITAATCMLGHLFPIWLKFKGGKGVATGFGVVLGFWPIFTLAGLAAGFFFLVVFFGYRYISLASITSAAFFAVLVTVMTCLHNDYLDMFQPPPDRYVLIGVACGFALMIIIRHRANIARLIKGTEPRFGQRNIDRSQMK